MNNQLIFDSMGLLQCVCGNTRDGGGFYSALSEGNGLEGQDAAIAAQVACLCCSLCSRIMNEFNRQVVWEPARPAHNQGLKRAARPQAGDVLEARTWLARNGNSAALACNRFETSEQAQGFVEKLYLLGAVKVIIDNIYAEAFRIKEEGGPYADTLFVEVPKEPEKRERLFAVFNQEARREGGQAHQDTGQRIVELWWD